MGNKASLSVAQRAQDVAALSKMKLSERQIAKTRKVSKTAVHNATNKLKKEATFANKQITGRPRIFSNKEKRLIRKVVTPMTSTEKNRFQLLERECRASTKTVQPCLFTEFRLKSHKPARKLRLTEAMNKKRLSFAEAHAYWTVDMGKKALLSDDSSIKQFSVRKYTVWGPAGQRYEKK